VYVQHEKQATKNVSIRALLLDAAENEVTIDEFKKRNDSEGVEHYSSTLTIKQPRRWDGKADPYRYTLRVELIRRNAGENQPEILDVVEQTFGAREFRVDPQQGVFLNGKPLDLHGVSRHQDRLDKGWAISRADMEEDFKIIDELGCTIVRLAHYQHDSYAYELADRAGIVVWAEIPLIDKITDSKAFLSNAEQQLTELIHQNHNHPSICFWGIHNEVTAPWKQPSPDPTEVVKRLNEVAKDADPTRLTVSAACDPVDHPANWQTDLTAFNRYFGWYTGEPDDIAQWCDDTHKKYPRTPLGISEYGAGASIHHHEWPPTKPVHNGPQHPEEWQTYLHERHWEAMKKRPYLWCKIIWNGFDFAVDSRNEGDTKGRNDKGLVTIDRKTKKDAWYWVQSQWSEKPMIHISHAARDALGAAAPIRIYSNCETVTVEIDGREVANHRDYDGAINYETFDLHPGTQSFKAIGRQGDQTVEATCVVVISRDSQK
ncbi:MAG: glycoside hydrolase family 2 protein, partial [Phycisphaerae bacterium]